jgi:3-phosphoshikimate 1-carboxyvinyltransferase
VTLEREMLADGRHRITLEGEAELHAKDIIVPRDPSSAAFAMVAALITKDSHITLPGISLNPQRTGLIITLQEMGGNIEIVNERIEGGEAVGDIIVQSSQLKGIAVPATRSASMIDEYPILSVAAACAEGETYMPGVAELRVKETDRISVMAEGLKACGVEVSETPDTMRVTGAGMISGGARLASQHDHRIAMSFLVLGMVAQNPITMLDVATISTSFPDFANIMNKAGAQLEEGITQA